MFIDRLSQQAGRYAAHMKNIISLLLFIALIFSFFPAAFADGNELEIHYNDINISFRTLDVDTVVSRALHFEAYCNGQKIEPVNWRSNNEGMARVDENGYVVLNLEKEGEVIISCQTTDGSGRICSTKLRFYKRVHNISLDHYSGFSMRSQSIVSLKPRFITPMGLEYTPTNPQLRWEIVSGSEYAYFSNPSSGTLCAENVSKAENILIRLSSGDNPKSVAYMNVTIQPAVEKISIFRGGVDVSGETFSAPVSSPVKLSAKVLPAQDGEIVWSSSSTNAKVMDGLVIASAPCSVIITAAAADGSGKSAGVTINFQ